MAKENIFPLFLDAPIQNVDGAADASWNGETSRVLVSATGAFDFTLGDATVPGTLVNILLDAAGGAVTVQVDSAPMGSTSVNDIVLSSQGEGVTLMWTGSEWFYMGSTEDTVVQ